jgi:TniQ
MPTQMLLRTPSPYQDESLAGYLIRLNESNYYSSPNWILQLAGLHINRRIPLGNNLDQPSKLSQLIQVKDEQIRLMASLPDQLGGDVNSRQYTIFNYARKLCPYCLIESAYCRKIWDWDLVTACSLHKCVLMTQCPGCQKNIQWSRPAVARCRCGFDFRTGQAQTATFHQVNLCAYLFSLENSLATVHIHRN